jgi:hypothetical protein
MTKISIQEDNEKIVAWQTKLFQKDPTEKITHYKTLQSRKYGSLGGVVENTIYFDTKIELEKGPTYLYEDGEFKLTRYLTGYAFGGGPSYRLSYAYPFNKEIIQKNEKAIKSIENLVGKTIIKRR